MTETDLEAAAQLMFEQGKVIIDAAVAEAVAAERERIAGAVRELLDAAMSYFNEVGAHVAHPPDEWASEARYAQAEAAVTALLGGIPGEER